MADQNWFAAYVRSRHEKKVADRLAERAIERFLPLYCSERRWSDRTVEVLLPLFAGYVFVRIERARRNDVLETPGVIYLVGTSGHPEAVDDAEIEALMRASDRRHKPRPHDYVSAIAVGERVVVTRGPLQGREGILVRDKGKGRVVVNVATIQRAMSVEVDMSDVSHISESPRAGGDMSARNGVLSVDAGELGKVALAVQSGSQGDPLLANAGRGLCPHRSPASSPATPKRSISGEEGSALPR